MLVYSDVFLNISSVCIERHWIWAKTSKPHQGWWATGILQKCSGLLIFIYIGAFKLGSGTAKENF